MTLLRLAAMIGASIALYLATFLWVHKPLTFGPVLEMARFKRELAASLPGQRLFVLAGSNGLYSHSCETLRTLVGRPCANLSLVSGVSVQYMATQYEDLFRRGDAIYLPLEYGQYLLNRRFLPYAPEYALLYRWQRDLLWQLGPARAVQAATSFTPQYLVQGLIEMTLAAGGVAPRFGVGNVNGVGDMENYSHASSAAWKQYVATMPWQPPSARAFSPDTDSRREIGDLVRRWSARGMVVVGGLPTTFDDVPIDAAVPALLADFFGDHGGTFLALPNLSQYPRAHFYDSAAHLTEVHQREHSKLLATPLQELLGRQ